MGFLVEKCTLTLLTQKILDNSFGFDCGQNQNEKDLNDFFLKDSINYSQQLLGKSYSFILKSDLHSIVCAFTVSNASINLVNIPNARRKKVQKFIPFEKQKRSYPAVLIGRLGVNSDFKGKGIGKELMNFIKAWFAFDNKTGCRYLVVDAYNESSVIQYYEKNDFFPLFSTAEQEAENSGVSLPLKTRLMLFDLIKLTSKES